jgi:hypothetical protein
MALEDAWSLLKMGVQDDYDPAVAYQSPEEGTPEHDMFQASNAELQATAEANDWDAQLARDELERRAIKRRAKRQGKDLRSIRRQKAMAPMTEEENESVQDFLSGFNPPFGENPSDEVRQS